ncbi:MAG TPA: methionine--tRNA ligase [Symbiobacteriaceae bacterium]
MTKFYITTPIYYPSDKLHIGHSYTTVAADALARYHRRRGHETWFLTGTDEHGQKIERAAAAAGKSPKEFVDEIVDWIKSLWKALHISYDDFIRTTDPRHQEAVQKIFRRLYEQGDIYKSSYEGWYCTPCETFWLEGKLAEGRRCPDCGRPVEWTREESYFFRLSKYADRLLKHIEEHPEFIQPVSRRNEMISFIKQGLEDLCVSRASVKWGIPVPVDENQVIYVWLDALSNYITALGWGTDHDELYRKFWPADVHLVGKEIVRFHAIIWPCILMALGEPLPKKVFGHGWLLFGSNAEKMSKSKGNVVDPFYLINQYGLDAVRYYLLREVPFGMDGSYTEEAFIARTNADLANDLGNLLSRTTQMINKFAGGKVPAPVASEDDGILASLAAQVVQEYQDAFDNLEISTAVAVIWKLVGRANKYIDEQAPWALAKDPAKADKLATVLYNLAEALRLIAVLLTPVLIHTPERIWEQLGLDPQGVRTEPWETAVTWGRLQPGVTIRRGAPLFPRIEVRKEKEAQAGQEQEGQAAAAAGGQAADAPEGVALIDYEDFAKVDLRVATIVAAERVPKADKLLKLELEVGDERRQIVSGIAQHYQPEDLIGKRIILVANLKPKKLRGIESYGMLLAATAPDGTLSLVTVDKADFPSGARVK